MKTEVEAQLPGKAEYVVKCELSGVQASATRRRRRLTALPRLACTLPRLARTLPRLAEAHVPADPGPRPLLNWGCGVRGPRDSNRALGAVA
eukprot:5548090-Prymnesium_polylepis.1